MNYKELYEEQLNRHYCTARELQYSNIYNYHLSLEELNGFYEYVDSTNDTFLGRLNRLELKTFNSNSLFYSKCAELHQLKSNFLDLLIDDCEKEDSFLSIRNLTEIIKSRVYSELEGSLNIENVPTTRKRFDDLVMKKEKPKNTNDQIIVNMANAIEFVGKKPAFNKENLYQLYCILSKDSLDYDNQLSDGLFYRNGGVYIDRYEGCPADKIEECMDSLFEFVNKNLKNKDFDPFLLPHIAHYYVLYIHPYFDYNGRTARMVSLWITLLSERFSFPLFISDAINQTRGNYYSALSETRNAHNDVTYFLMYVFDILVLYFLTYKNIENIDMILKNKGIVITNADKDYIKRILVSAKGPFQYTDFTSWNHIQITKQGALKILNRFVEYGVLQEAETTSNKKLFIVNKEMIAYEKK